MHEIKKPLGVWKEIERLCRIDATLAACYDAAITLDLSREALLEMMVIEQTKAKKCLLDASVQCHETCTKSALFPYFSKAEKKGG